MLVPPSFAKSGLADSGWSEPPVSTSSHTAALIARYTLEPGVGVGPLRFGDHVADHPQLEPRELSLDELGLRLGLGHRLDGADGEDGGSGESDLDDLDEGDDYSEYSIPGLDEFLIVYVDGDDRIDSVGFYESCEVGGRDLIGMGVGELLVRLGIPSTIEADSVGPEADILYGYDRLGLTLWTIDGEVCVVHAGLADA
jgi:hypothetical protein